MAGRSVEFARAFVTLDAETKGLDNQLSQAEKSLGRTAAFIKANPVAAAAAIGTAAIAAAISLIKMAEETNKALGIIADRVPGAQGQIAGLRQETGRLATQYGQTHDAVITTMDAVSKAGAKSVDDLLLTTEAAIKAGVAIGKSGVELVGGLDAALDIFGLGAKDATAAMALFFGAAEGRTSVEDLLETVNRLAPAIQGTGLDLATTTRALAAIIDEGFQPGKKSIAEFTRVLKEGGSPAIHELAERAKIDGVEAMDKFTAAIQRNSNSMDANIQKAKSEWKSALLEIGSALEPIGRVLGSVFAKLVKDALDPYGVKAYAQQAAAAARESQSTATSLEHLATAGGIATTSFKGLSAAQKQAIESSKTLTEEQKQGLLAATSLTKEQTGLLKKAVKETSDSAAKAQKEANDIFLEIQRLAGRVQIDLLTGHQKEMADLIATFEEKIADLERKGGSKRVEEARALLNEAQEDLRAHWAGLDTDVIPPIKRTEQAVGDLKTGSDDLAGAVGRVQGKQDALTAVLGNATQEQIKHRLEIENVTGKMDSVSAATVRWADAILSTAQNLGIATPEMEQAVGAIYTIDQGIQGLHQNLSKLLTAQNLGQGLSGLLGTLSGVGAIIGGLGGILHSLFSGESASAKFLRLELEKTRNKIEELRGKIGDLIAVSIPGAQVASIQGALAAALKPGALKGVRSLTGEVGIADTELAKFLAPRGLKVSDIEGLAKELGVSLRDDKGLLNRKLINAFLSLLGELDTGIPKDFGSQLDFIKKRGALAGTSKQDLLSQVLALVTGLGGSPFLASALAGLSPAEILQALPDIFAGRGAVGAAGLGGLTLPQFDDILDLLASLIRDIQGEATNPAATPTEPAPNTPPTPVTGDPTDPLPVEPVPDPIFPAELEKANWEELLGVEHHLPDLLQQILDRMPSGILAAPNLPVNIFGGIATATGPSPNLVQVTISGPIQVFVQDSGNPEDDGRRAGQAFVDEVLGARFLDARSAQGNNTVFFR